MLEILATTYIIYVSPNKTYISEEFSWWVGFYYSKQIYKGYNDHFIYLIK